MSASANCGILGLQYSLASEIMQYALMLADIWEIEFCHIQKIDSHPIHRTAPHMHILHVHLFYVLDRLTLKQLLTHF